MQDEGTDNDTPLPYKLTLDEVGDEVKEVHNDTHPDWISIALQYTKDSATGDTTVTAFVRHYVQFQY